MELIEEGGGKEKSFACGNRRGEGEHYRILTASTEREKYKGDRSLLFHSWRHTISIFSTVLLFSRVLQNRWSLIRAMVSISGERKKKKERKKKIRPFFLSRFSLFDFLPSSRHEWSSTAGCETTIRSCSWIVQRTDIRRYRSNGEGFFLPLV